MKADIKRYITKLFAIMLAVFIAIPSQIFAAAANDTDPIEASSIMDGVDSDPLFENDTNEENTVLSSDTSIDETDEYIIEKSATINTEDDEILYKIVLLAKDNTEQDPKENLSYMTSVFAVNCNSDHRDIKVEKVTYLDETGAEENYKYKVGHPNFIESNKNIQTLGIRTVKPQYGMVYYLSSKLKDREEISPDHRFNLDMAILDHDETTIYESRYALTTNDDKDERVLDEDGNVVAPADLIELEGEIDYIPNGLYIEDINSIFNYVPANIKWSDFIYPTTGEEFTYRFDLDSYQNTENTQVRVEFYEAHDNGFVLNNSFSQTLPYTNEIQLQIPEGQLARIVFNTTVAANQDVPSYSFNGKEIKNEAYIPTEDRKDDEQSTSKTNDEDPLPEIDEETETKASEVDQIADDIQNEEAQIETHSKKETEEADINVTDETPDQAPDAHLSAIELNKDAFKHTLGEENKLTEEYNQKLDQAALILEALNNGDIERGEFIDQIKTLVSDMDLTKAQIVRVSTAFLAGLDEDNYKIVAIDPLTLANLVIDEESEAPAKEESETTVTETLTGKDSEEETLTSARETELDQLVAEKLSEESLNLEAFQQFMYDLDEKYSLSDKEVDRIYGANAEKIEALIEKHRKENIGGNVLATVPNPSEEFTKKTFELKTQMDVKAFPNSQIPAGWYFDVNIGPYLTPGIYPLKSLSDPKTGRIIATPTYKESTNTIRYTFPNAMRVDTSLPINQELEFNTAKIPADAQYVDIEIKTKAKNNPEQAQPTKRVHASDPTVVSNAVVTKEKTSLITTYPKFVKAGGDSGIRPSSEDENKLEAYWEIDVDTSILKDDKLAFNNIHLGVYTPSHQLMEDINIQILADGREIYNETLADDERFEGIDLASLNFTKASVPSNIKVNVTAKPTAFTNQLSVGLRLTPDQDYLNTLLVQAKNKYASLPASRWENGMRELEELVKSGNNLLDRRYPALTEVRKEENGVISKKSPYEQNVYHDQTRSMYGHTFTENNKAYVEFHVSDTFNRERIATGNVTNTVDQIYAASFNNGLNKLNANPKVEILTPNYDGTYTKNLVNDKTNPSADELKNALANIKAGTIVNYAYTLESPNANSNHFMAVGGRRITADGRSSYEEGEAKSYDWYFETGGDLRHWAVPHSDIDDVRREIFSIGPKDIPEKHPENGHKLNKEVYTASNYPSDADYIKFMNRVFYYVDDVIAEFEDDFLPGIDSKGEKITDLDKYAIIQYAIRDVSKPGEAGDKFASELGLSQTQRKLGAELSRRVTTTRDDSNANENVSLSIYPKAKNSPSEFKYISAEVTKPVTQNGELTIRKVRRNGNQNELITQDSSTFELVEIEADGDVVASPISQNTSRGVTIFKDLKPNSLYKLTETKAPQGYNLSNNIYKVRVNEIGEVSVVRQRLVETTENNTTKRETKEEFVGAKSFSNTIDVVNREKSSASVAFKWENTPQGQDLRGVEFTLTNNNTRATNKSTTNASGIAELNGLEPGTYSVTITKVPNGFKIPQNGFTITVDESGDALLFNSNFEKLAGPGYKLTRGFSLNTIEQGFRVRNESGQGLRDLAFSLLRDGNKVTNLRSGNDGKFTASGLAPGKYELRQENKPNGYQMPTNPVARFSVDESGNVIQDGKDAPETIDILNVRNIPYGTSSFAIKKTNEANEALQNAEFTIYKTISNVEYAYQKQSTDRWGNATFINLSPGTYTLRETQAPNGYARSSQSETITVNDDGTVDWTTNGLVTNTKQTGSRTVAQNNGWKPSANYNYAYGTYIVAHEETFYRRNYMTAWDYGKVTNANNGEIEYYLLLKPDNDRSGEGKTYYDQIPVNNNETNRPTALEFSANNASITSVEMYEDYSATKNGARNAMANGTMDSYIANTKDVFLMTSFDTKVNVGSGNKQTPIWNDGSTIGIHPQRFHNDWIWIVKVKAKVDDKFSESSLGYNWTARDWQWNYDKVNGDLKHSQRYPALAKSEYIQGSNSLEITNRKSSNGSFNLQLINNERQFVGPANFVLEGNGMSKNIDVDSVGRANVTNLAPGNYVIRQTSAPSGHLLNPLRERITVNEDGTISNTGDGLITNDGHSRSNPTIQLFNQKLPTKTFTVGKIDEDFNPIKKSSASFEIINKATGEKVNEGSTNDQGNVSFTGLEMGDYIIREVKAPDTYALSSNPIHLNVGIDRMTYYYEDDPARVYTIGGSDEKETEEDTQVDESAPQRIYNDGSNRGVEIVNPRVNMIDKTENGANYANVFYADVVDKYDSQSGGVNHLQGLIEIEFDMLIGEGVRAGDTFVMEENEYLIHGINEEHYGRAFKTGRYPLDLVDNRTGEIIAHGRHIKGKDGANGVLTYTFTDYVERNNDVKASVSFQDYIINRNAATESGFYRIAISDGYNDFIYADIPTIFPEAIYFDRTLGYTADGDKIDARMTVRQLLYATNSNIDRGENYVRYRAILNLEGDGPSIPTKLRITPQQAVAYGAWEPGINTISTSDVRIYEISEDYRSTYVDASMSDSFISSRNPMEGENPNFGETRQGYDYNITGLKDGVKDVTSQVNMRQVGKDVHLDLPAMKTSGGNKAYVVEVKSPYKNYTGQLQPAFVGIQWGSDINNKDRNLRLSRGISIADNKASGSSSTPTPTPGPLEADARYVNRLNKVKFVKQGISTDETIRIPGVRFNLTTTSNNGFMPMFVTSDENGAFDFTGLPDGSYKLTEQPMTKIDGKDVISYNDSNYYISEPITFKIADGKLANISTNAKSAAGEYIINNEKVEKKGILSLTKVGTNGDKLENVTFALFDDADNEAYTATTDKSGRLTFTDISAGRYTLRETMAADGYKLLTDTSWNVRVDSNGMTTVTDSNNRIVRVDDPIEAKVVNRNKYYIDGIGQAETRLSLMPDGRYEVITTLFGSNHENHYTEETNIARETGEVATFAQGNTVVSRKRLVTKTFARTINEENDPKAEYYLLLNTNNGPYNGEVKITNNLWLQVKEDDNVAIENIEIYKAYTNDSDQGQQIMEDFESKVIDAFMSKVDSTDLMRLTKNPLKLEIHDKGKGTKKIEIDRSHFDYSNKAQGQLLVKVTADINDPTKATSFFASFNHAGSHSHDLGDQKDYIKMPATRLVEAKVEYTPALVGSLEHKANSNFRIVDGTKLENVSLKEGEYAELKSIIEYEGSLADGQYMQPLASTIFTDNEGVDHITGLDSMPVVDVKENKSSADDFVVANEPNEISFQKFAVSNTTVTTLPDVRFQLRNVESGKIIDTQISNDDGQVRFKKVINGDYELIEEIPEDRSTDNGLAIFTRDGKKYSAPDDGVVATFTVSDNKFTNVKAWRRTKVDQNSEATIGLVVSSLNDFDKESVRVDNETSPTEFTYPSTGGSGVTIAFALIGTAVMLMGIIYYAMSENHRRRRGYGRR